MEKSNSNKTVVLTILLVVAVIAICVMGCFIYKSNNEKSIAIEKVTELKGKVSDLEETVSQLQGKIGNIANTINSDTENNSTSNKEFKKVILEGNYAIDASDVGYTFDKNGNVSCDGDMDGVTGTYETIGENEIKITYTEKYQYNDETGEKTTQKINRTEIIKVLDENTLQINNENGSITKLIKNN